MTRRFQSVAVIGKPEVPQISAALNQVCNYLATAGLAVAVERSCAHLLQTPGDVFDITAIDRSFDLAIAVGGDGTFITVARLMAPHQIPVAGINLGRLGFLVDVSPAEIIAKLDEILSGNFIAEQRALLCAEIIRDGIVIRKETAVNEVVIHRWITTSMIEIITRIDGVFLNSQRSDGLIVSTPTGSTAYALAGGGPIMHPGLNALVLVPINPHTLTNRPIVVDDNCVIEVAFAQNKTINAQVSCDNVAIPDVLMSDRLIIRKAPQPIHIVHPSGYDFFEILRSKLHWSSIQ